MSAQTYVIAKRRSAARLLQAADAQASPWHQAVQAMPGVVITGGTAGQLTVQAEAAAIEQLRQILGEGFLIEPQLPRGTADGPDTAASP